MASETSPIPRKRVAVIGSGAAGIGALWALNRTHHDVYMYEAADRLGGHANTVEFKKDKYKTLVDTGVAVLNASSCPNFTAFLSAVGIPTVPTKMTFGASRDSGKLEWGAASLSTVFTQWASLLSPRLWKLALDIIRFDQFAQGQLELKLKAEEYGNGNARDGGSHTEDQETIGHYLERKGYSNTFRDDYIIPMLSILWTGYPDKASLELPAVTLLRLMWDHNIVRTAAARPRWVSLKYGFKSYIDAAMKGFPPNHLFLNTPVKSLTNDEDGRVRLHLANGKSQVYDHVVVATHGDQAQALILPGASHEEFQILSGFQTRKLTAILHSDLSLMPKSRKAWSSWNYITESSAFSPTDQSCLTYNMNILQNIPEEIFGPVLVTTNPLHLPNPDHVQGRYTYLHPLYNPAAIRSQRLLPRIQNKRGISYCGAWTSYGSHEDGFSSGLKVAQDHLGAKLPFKFKDSTLIRGTRPVLGIRGLLLRIVIVVIQMMIMMMWRLVVAQKARGRQLERRIKKCL